MKGTLLPTPTMNSVRQTQRATRIAEKWSLLGWLLQLTVFLGAFYEAVEFIKPAVSTASLTLMDLLLAAVFLAWLYQVARGRIKIPSLSRYKSLYFFIIMLLVPILVGLIRGHVLQTVLRDARAPYYFLLSLCVISFVKDERTFRRLLLTLAVVGTIAVVWDFAVYIFRIPIHTNLAYQLLTSGRVNRHFGYHSTHMLLLACIFLIVNYLFVSKNRKRRAYKLSGLIVFMAGICLTLIRGLFTGMVFGTLVAILIQKSKRKGLILIGACSAAMIVGGVLALASSNTISRIMAIPVVERYTSIVDPSVTTRESRESGEGRFRAVAGTIRAIQGHEFFGMGFGEIRRPKNTQDVVDPVLTLAVHSIWGWMIYRTGFVGTLILLSCSGLFILRGFRSFLRSPLGTWSRIGYGTASVFFVTTYLVGTGGNLVFGNENFSPLIAIMLGLILCKMDTKSQSASDNQGGHTALTATPLDAA